MFPESLKVIMCKSIENVSSKAETIMGYDISSLVELTEIFETRNYFKFLSTYMLCVLEQSHADIIISRMNN